MRALILAAGEGSRLRPFTISKPKPMVRAANKPIAQHVVEALVANGVKDITFVLGYQRTKVQSHFADGAKFGARVSYAFQEALLGTAHALATAPVPRNEPFLVVGGDNLVDANLIKAVLGAPGESPAMVVHRSQNPSRYGVVSLDGNRNVERIVEKPDLPRSEWVNTGVYRLTPQIHERAARMAEAGPIGLPEVLQGAVDDDVVVQAVKSDDLWIDAVYPWDLLRVHGELLRQGRNQPDLPGVHSDPGVMLGRDAVVGPGTFLGAGTCIGNNVEIHPNCILENVVVYDDARIGAGTVLRNTIVGEGAHLGARTTAVSGPCDVKVADGWHALDDFGAIIGEDARIGGAVTLLPGAFLGNKVRVAPGRQVAGSIEDEAQVL